MMTTTPTRPLRGAALAKAAGLSRTDVDAIAASSIFDERFYLMTYPDVAEAGVDAFEHYLIFGRFEKRKASAIFDPVAYAEANPEVAASGMEPFLHYALVGQAAGAGPSAVGVRQSRLPLLPQTFLQTFDLTDAEREQCGGSGARHLSLSAARNYAHSLQFLLTQRECPSSHGVTFSRCN